MSPRMQSVSLCHFEPYAFMAKTNQKKWNFAEQSTN
jgi:hypothetical protein